MNTEAQRAARAAFDAARASFERLTRTGDARDTGSVLVEAWTGTERVLRLLAGSSVLEGVALVRELRQRSLITLDDAHALVDLHAAAERAREVGYLATPADVDAARLAQQHLERVLAADSTPPDATPFAGPISTPIAPRPAAVPPPSVAVAEPARSNTLAIALVVIALAVVAGVGAWYARGMSREPSALRQGRAAFAAGDRLTARNAFAMAVSEAPTLAEPHIYLGRLAREGGDAATASAELRRAVELEPQNYLAHRELAGFLLATGQVELARSFYQRAIELNPNDKVSLGFMACTLQRMGRVDLAGRFFQRAGPGEWLACQSAPPPAPAATLPLPR